MAEKKGSNNLINYMSNPRSFTLKKWFVELLKENYPPHNDIIERVSTSITTEGDLEAFGRLVTQIYESGYKKAVNDYKVEAEKMGLKITIVPPKES